MKPRNWRQYYGYRPQTLAQLGRLSDTAIRAQERAYIEWLAESRGWGEEQAEKHARSQAFGDVVSAVIAHDSNARAEEWLSGSCCIRTVRCHYTRKHWEFSASWRGAEPAWHWERLSKPDAPTTYAVIIDGRCVNSFLSKSRAKEWALAQLSRPTMQLAA